MAVTLSVALPVVTRALPWSMTCAQSSRRRGRASTARLVLPVIRSSREMHEGQQAESQGIVQKRIGGALMMPLLAVALVGSSPIMEAFIIPSVAVAVEVDTRDSYKELLQKFKERRASPSLAPAPKPEQESISPAAPRLKVAAEKARLERDVNEARLAQKQEESRRAKESAAPAVDEKEKAAVEKVGVVSAKQQTGVPSITIKKKTHGFLPLFVSQFFLLLATLGVGAILFVLPESQLKEVTDKLDDLLEKATPVAEDVYSKAVPVASQAWQKAQDVGVLVKPYVERAWVQAKPLAIKAVDASKPLFKEAQVKANELLQQVQNKTK